MLAEVLEKRTFSWEDYAVFSSMLIISAIIGVYHGFSWGGNKVKKEEKESAGEFLIGGGKMQTIPVALSMLARPCPAPYNKPAFVSLTMTVSQISFYSFLSSITLMGQPAEVYLFGPQIWLMGLAAFLAVPIVSEFFVDFFRDLNVTSAYQYFGQRFNRGFQRFASIIFSIQMLLYLALVLYAPALALHQVTGINVEIVVAVMYLVCIFYTTIGGIRAVIWTDTFQVVVLFGAMLTVLIKGTMVVGGFSVVWERNAASNRTNLFNFDVDPLQRYSVWSTLIGGAFLHLSVFCGNQLQIQRMLTVPNVQEVKKMLWINAFGWTFIVLLTAYSGMLIFAQYFECDPLGSKQVKSADQLFPLFVMDVLGDYKGFPGLFVAGIFSAGLSTVSTGVNSLAAIWFSELDGTNFKKNLSPKKSGMTVKLLALVFGLLSFGIVFVVPFMGTLVPITISISGFFSGSLFGIFLLGRYIPFANSWGAFFGLSSGVAVVGWLTIGAQIATNNGQKVFDVLPLSTSFCLASNATLITQQLETPLALAPYRISFLWYSLFAVVLTVAVGTAVSFLAHCVSPKIPLNRLRVSKNGEVAFRLVAGGDLQKTRLDVFVPKDRHLEPTLLVKNQTEIV